MGGIGTGQRPNNKGDGLTRHIARPAPKNSVRPTSRVIFGYNFTGVSEVFTSKLRKVGGSVMLAIPPAVLDMLQLNPGQRVGLSVDGSHLVVDPQVRPRYTLDELLAQCDTSADITAEDQVWLDGQPIGREVL